MTPEKVDGSMDNERWKVLPGKNVEIYFIWKCAKEKSAK